MTKKKVAKKALGSKVRTQADSGHPCHSAEITKIKKISGQLEGIMRMIDEKRYCPDIINQIRAARTAFVSVEASILETHLKNCVTEAIKSKNSKETDRKIEELMKLFKSAKSKGI